MNFFYTHNIVDEEKEVAKPQVDSVVINTDRSKENVSTNVTKGSKQYKGKKENWRIKRV